MFGKKRIGKILEEPPLCLMEEFFLHFARGIKNVYENVQAGITSSLL
jgi:hypothetical protein